ncbi:MAG TPA: MerR family transcriptional regulator [Sporichthyaceae bacterium]|nr:MerR family transcriptional regulator [Sporichthyaceae bacterium]
MNSPASAGGYFSIGEVLAALQPDFPDVTISKIRFLEDKGLIEPARTPSGYRQFCGADVERLRYVLTAQRDRYLPLKVIKDNLAALDTGTEPVRLDRAGMLAATGLNEAALTELDASGMLARRRGGHYNADDVAIAGIVAELARFGLEPRHLRAFKGAADREVGVIEAAAVPRAASRNAEDRAAARAKADELVELFLQLHSALLRAGVRRDIGG